MENNSNKNSQFSPTDAVASAESHALRYGAATGLIRDNVIATNISGSRVLSYKEYLSYLSCEYINGIIFLALSIIFALAVPLALSKPGGLSQMVNRTVKRTTDIVSSLVGLVLTLPFWFIIPLLIKLTSKGPVFYTQVRVGINRRKNERRFVQQANLDDDEDSRNRERRRVDYLGTTFKLIKFRTMIHNAEKESGPVWAEKNDPRITKLGKFLRKTRIDEIPQFLNILFGHMSIIGPRPERPDFMEKLSSQVENYERRLEVKPGLTGLAQVTSGYDSSVASVIKKVHYDVDYIDNWSFWKDIKIILRTVVVVITGRGAN